LFSLTAFVIVGGLLVGSGLSRGLPGRFLFGFSIVCMGVFAFLQPLLLEAPVRSLIRTSPALALGTTRLRVAVSLAALLLLLISLFLTLLDL
jgi:hypothetical protein